MSYQPTIDDVSHFLWNAIQDALEYYTEAAAEMDDNKEEYKTFVNVAEWLLREDRYTHLADGVIRFLP